MSCSRSLAGSGGRGHEHQVESDLDDDQHPCELAGGVDIAEAHRTQRAEREVEGVGLGAELGELGVVGLLQREVAE